MGYDDATIRPQHVSPPRSGRCGTGTHTVFSKPRDGIMERLIAQDPMIIAASSRGVMHTQTDRAEYCEKAPKRGWRPFIGPTGLANFVNVSIPARVRVSDRIEADIRDPFTKASIVR